MDRYQRVEKPRAEDPIKENEIRITAQGLIRSYITYASTLLQEKQAKEIVLKAMGQAISKTVAIVEIIKKRIPGLYQETSISSTRITDVWEPIEEGLETVEITRQVSLITVTLSLTELNKNSPGFQAPSHVEQRNIVQQPQQQQHQELESPKRAYFPTSDVNQDSYGGRGQGRGRGRGRGRGWARGGYGNNLDNDRYNHGGRGGGRGRGRGRGWSNGGVGYERGRGSGRGYGRGRGRMGGRGRVAGDQA